MDAATFLASWLYDRLEWLNKKWGVGYEDNNISISFDLTDPTVVDTYLHGYSDSVVTQTEDGLHLVTPDAYDPYFHVDIELMQKGLMAEDLPYLELELMLPPTNGQSTYHMEIFLCAGDVVGATGGISVVAQIGSCNGQFQTVMIDLSQSPYWTGEIHSIRIDYFSGGVPGDTMVIKSVTLTN